MKQLRIQSFGSFRLMLDDRPCTHPLNTEKSRALFLYLLIEHDRPQPRARVEVAPWSELAHQRYMKALALAGERGKALQQFEVCRHMLVAGPGMEPSYQTRCLSEQIRNDSLDRSEWIRESPLQN